MPRKLCERCNKNPVNTIRRKTGKKVCKDCFIEAFEFEVGHTILFELRKKHGMMMPGQRVAIGASGGKDSCVLIEVLNNLNNRLKLGLELVLVSIDEGIAGYRDDSLQAVHKHSARLDLPLTILSYDELYNWTMDKIVAEIGKKNNCTYCGILRRQSLDRGASLVKADVVALGHNADDVAETVLMNLLRGDLARLARCTNLVADDDPEACPRVKPFHFCIEHEIVLYAKYKKLEYFSTECTYAPDAYRGHARHLIRSLEIKKKHVAIEIIRSGEAMAAQIKAGQKIKQTKAELQSEGGTKSQLPGRNACKLCGFISSTDICKACVLLKGLNMGKPKMAVTGKIDMTQERENADKKIDEVTEKIQACGDRCKTSCDKSPLNST